MIGNPRFRALTIAIGMAILVGCNDHSSNNAATPQEHTDPASAMQVMGRVFLDAPVAGATVAVKDSAGNLLIESKNATDQEGFYTVTLPGESKDFTVEVTGGRSGTNAFSGVLKADIENFSPDSSIVYLNAATTLASVYRTSTRVNKAEADMAVKKLLNLPGTVDLGVDIVNPALTAFSHQKFMQVAQEQGGFNSLINQLVNILKQPEPQSPYVFSTLLLQGGFNSFFNSLKDVVVEVGKSALTDTKSSSNTDIAIAKMGFELAGSAITAITSTAGQSDSRAEEILEKLDIQNAKLNRISSQIINLETSVNKVSSDIEKLGKEIATQFGLSDYNTTVNGMNRSVSAINTLYRQYQSYLQKENLTAKDKEKIEKLANKIIEDIPLELDSIHNALIGQAGTKGAIKQWHIVVSNANRQGENGGNRYPFIVNDKYFDNLNEQFEYFYALQVRALAMLVDAHKYLDENEEAQTEYKLYKTNLNDQEALLYSTRIDSGLLVSPVTNTMFSAKPACTSDSCVIQVSKGRQQTVLINNLVENYVYKDYEDWRLPTDMQLFALGKDRTDRKLDALIKSGFDLNFIKRDANGSAFIWSSSTYDHPDSGTIPWGLNTTSGQINFFAHGSNMNNTIILLARDFVEEKVDIYAGTIESNKITN